jgi:hypothetical protein
MAMTKHLCDACRRPIKEGQAALVENTPAATRRWHLACCPIVPRLPEPAGKEPAHAAPRPAT